MDAKGKTRLNNHYTRLDKQLCRRTVVVVNIIVDAAITHADIRRLDPNGGVDIHSVIIVAGDGQLMHS